MSEERYQRAMLDKTQPFHEVQVELLEQLQAFALQHGPTPVTNLSIHLKDFALLPLLKAQTNKQPIISAVLPCIYWQDKQQNSLASFGKITQSLQIPEVQGEQFFLGGLAFQQQGEQWPDFPATLFVQPALTFKQTEIGILAICQFNGLHAIQDTIRLVKSLCAPVPLSSSFSANLLQRQDSPNQAQWANLVELAIEYKALLPKVVLSRQTQLCFDKKLDAWDIMGLWQQANPNSYHYVFQFSEQQAFVSCSPESLYSRSQQSLHTEALAGTVNRGRDQREDQLLLQSLLNDKKIDRENYLVQEFIIANLMQLKAKVECAPAHVMQLQHVQHLCVPIKAQLTPQTKDSELLYKLHPTPAVAGTPKLPALQFVNDNEPYTRGWYAGAVGYLSQDESDFSVAIRSALVSGKCIKLFAGAGIVTGSIAEQEWQELENKIQTILTLLDAQ